MRQFAALYRAIDESNRTNAKVAAMVDYFRTAPPADAAWAVNFLIGRRPKRLLNSGLMFKWASEASSLPEWLFGECYDAVGDLAETVALALPDFAAAERNDRPLSEWVTDRLLPLATQDEAERRATMIQAWIELDHQERFVWNKLITGSFRVGVSQELVTRALAQVTGLPAAVIAHRLAGDWTPTADFFLGLFGEATAETDLSKPYPFSLAHPLEAPPESLGSLSDWHAEWKWDGIRAQVIRRNGETFVWSRGEELITDRFPEIAGIAERLPDGTVLDGEILAWADGKPLKFMELQKRIGRKTLTKKILKDVPVVLVAFDLLELGGQDFRERPFRERRLALENLVDSINRVSDGFADLLGFPKSRPAEAPKEVDPRLAVETSDEEDMTTPFVSSTPLLLAAPVPAATWEDLAAHRLAARELNVEGLMLKRMDGPYLVGRKRGNWWKWKVDPLTVDAVLVYAQRGSGKRASLYTDYTFAVWSDGKLVPFAKAYSGLNDEEIRRVDAFVRRHTVEKFGPVRTVTPELVMELAFEGIQLSTRHKSGIAVRFPRISRWRHDKKPADADSLESVKAMLNAI